MNIILLARVDALAQSGRQRMVLVQHDGNFAISGTEYNLDVQADQGSQPLFWIGNAAYWSEDTFLSDLHGMVHDLEQDFIFALEMMVEAALAELESRGDVVHRGGIVAALLEQAGGGAQNLLPGIYQGFARHRVSW